MTPCPQQPKRYRLSLKLLQKLLHENLTYIRNIAQKNTNYVTDCMNDLMSVEQNKPPFIREME